MQQCVSRTTQQPRLPAWQPNRSWWLLVHYALRLPALFQHAQALMARSWVVPDQIGSSTVVQLALFHSARLVLRMLTQNLHMVKLLMVKDRSTALITCLLASSSGLFSYEHAPVPNVSEAICCRSALRDCVAPSGGPSWQVCAGGPQRVMGPVMMHEARSPRCPVLPWSAVSVRSHSASLPVPIAPRQAMCPCPQQDAEATLAEHGDHSQT